MFMEIFRDFETYHSSQDLALSLGMFDGVHKGHQMIIKKLNEAAKERNLASAILTFWPHPRLVLQPDADLKLLNTIEEKTDLLANFGIEYLFLKHFDEAFRNLSGEEFVRQILVEKLHIKYLIVGYDHVFGKNKSGNFQLLERLAPELGFEVIQVEAVNLQHQNISSTKIRTALSEGKITQANEMLGYAYPLSGKVIHGKEIGRTIGFPTANISLNPQKLLPKNGAYIVDTFVNGQFYKGMASVGNNPTIEGDSFTVEVYILNFNQDIYGQEISIHFRDFLHEEIKFESLEKLMDRLQEDERLTRKFYQV